MASKRCCLVSITLSVIVVLFLICLVGWHFTPDGGSAPAWVQAFFASAAIVVVVFLQQWANQRTDAELRRQQKIHMKIAEHLAEGVLKSVQILPDSVSSSTSPEQWRDRLNVLDDMYAQALSLDCNAFQSDGDAEGYLKMLEGLRKVRGYVRHIALTGCPERGLDSLRHDCKSAERAADEFLERVPGRMA